MIKGFEESDKWGVGKFDEKGVRESWKNLVDFFSGVDGDFYRKKKFYCGGFGSYMCICRLV